MKLKSFIFLVVVACMLISCKDNKKLISEYEQALAMEDYDRAEEILDEIDEFSLTDAEVEHLERLSQEKMYEELEELEELMNDLDYDDYSYDYDDYDDYGYDDDYDDYDYDDYSYDYDDYDYYY
jgi:uncharacterized protein YcfL